jgi:very-short-patch-repair endonuclease
VSRPPHQPPRLLRGPFRGADAIASGQVSKSQLRGRSWRRLYPDVYVSAAMELTPVMRIQAAALWLPKDSVITGRSAAQLWGVQLGDEDTPVEALCATRVRVPPGLAIRIGRIPADEIAFRRGLVVTTPGHTAWEIGRALPQPEAIGWIDALARRKHLSNRELRAHADLHRGETGSRRATLTLAQADARAESPPESRLRVAFATAGLPTPVPQFSVIIAGYFVARVDLAWPAWRFAVEYDGQWHADRAQLHRDRVRDRELSAAGWFVFHVTREDMHDMPRLVGQITALLRLRRDAIGA